ncbi:MAG: endonuclease MutS2 [Firmicutes bacterium]|nr:endonuclease MutS2 [Bacillota bacterium]
MNEKILVQLEFDVIRSRLVGACRTPYGRERAAALIPHATLNDVLRALDATGQAMALLQQQGGLDLPDTEDIRPAVQRAAAGAILPGGTLLAISSTLNGADAARRALDLALERSDLPILAELLPALQVDRELSQEIARCIDEEGLVRDRASAALASIRSGMRTKKDRMRRTLEEMVRSPAIQKFLQELIITVRRDRYCLAVRADAAGQIRGIVHDASASGSTLFIEPERVVLLGNELRKLQADEERELDRILGELSWQVGARADALLQVTAAFAKLDFACAKARLAREQGGHAPTLSDDGVFALRGARHPLLGERAVPLYLDLGGPDATLIITGPNTGGKTVAMKTLGLLTIMAHAGLFIPADPATHIGFVEEVFADIGDEQSIEQSLSTFSSHMTHIVEILGRVSARSLVLLDELGAGTDPEEGAALAIAILERLAQFGARTAATTHYSELKAYAHTTAGVTNASMEFDEATLQPTYRLLMGVPGRSNAFAIARRLGLSAGVLERAQRALESTDAHVEDLIRQLHASLAAQRASEEILKQREQRLAERERELSEALARVEKEAQERLRAARDEAATLVTRAKREADAIIAELRERRHREEPGKDHELTELRRRLRDLSPENEGGARPAASARRGDIRVGDEVRVLTFGGQPGTIVEAADDELTVAVGSMKVKVAASGVERMNRKERREVTAASFVRTNDAVSHSIDVRGRTVEEAMADIDHYLDSALIAGFRQVTLIHGKGTGALRAGLQQFLRAHPHVATVRAGGMGEGGTGVTVCELR